MDYIIKLNFKTLSEYLTTHKEGYTYNETQYNPGKLLSVNLTKTLTIDEYSPTRASIIIDDNTGYFRSFAETEFDSISVVIYSVFNNAVTLEATLNVYSYSPGNQFQIEATSDLPGMKNLCLDKINLKDFPMSPDANVGSIIPFWAGYLDPTLYPNPLLKIPRVNSPFGHYFYCRLPFQASVLGFTPELWDGTKKLVYTTDFTTVSRPYTFENGTTGTEVYIIYPAGTADFLKSYPMTLSLSVLEILKAIVSTWTTLPIDVNSETNIKFSTAMANRGFLPGECSIILDQSISVEDGLNMVCKSLGGVSYRFAGNGSLEFIALDLETLPTASTCQTALIQDISQNVIIKTVENQTTYDYQYSQFEQTFLKNTTPNLPDKKYYSVSRFGKNVSRDTVKLRFCYTETQTNIVDIYQSLFKLRPEKTVQIKMRYQDACKYLPGDYLRFAHSNDATAGKIERTYLIRNIDYSKSFSEEINITALDITHFQNLKSLKLLIHAFSVDSQKFYDSSIFGNVKVQNTSVTQVDAPGFPGGIAWTGSGMYDLRISQKTANYDLYNVDKIGFSFPFQITDLTRDQCLFCISNTSIDSYWGIEFVTASKALRLYHVVNGVNTFTPVLSATNSMNDTAVHWFSLYKGSNGNLAFFIDGLQKGFITYPGSIKSIVGILYIGVEKKFSGSYTKRFYGKMGNFAIYHKENLLNSQMFASSTATCIVPTQGLSWEGVVS